MKRHEDESHENHERWLLTYSDLITLLMIFFVIMYAMSNVDAEKYNQLANSMGLAMGGGKNIIGSDKPGEVPQTPNVVDQIDEFNKTKEEIDKFIKENNLTGSVETELTDRGLQIRLKNSLLFDSGKADINPGVYTEITKVGKILNKVDGYIRIEGHTDNVPMGIGSIKSNWQLSSMRASNIAEYLIKMSGISPERVAAIGYGEYRPVGDNNTAEGRAKNRRVDIVIVNNKYSETENNKK
jgi:chemotaxis protein MotB